MYTKETPEHNNHGNYGLKREIGNNIGVDITESVPNRVSGLYQGINKEEIKP